MNDQLSTYIIIMMINELLGLLLRLHIKILIHRNNINCEWSLRYYNMYIVPVNKVYKVHKLN